MPVPACPHHPALSPLPEPVCAMEEPSNGVPEPWAEGLRNSNNNNASPAGWHPLAPFGSAGAEPSYLGRVVLEIVESERTYARDLRGIVEGYLGKIIDAEEPVLRPEQVSALFGNIEDIYELSSTLLQNLESCASDPVAVAVCFVTRSQEFAIYTQYCNNYPSSVAALAECMRSKAQARFLRECQERLRHALPLGAYLLKPVQRILKYHLLLQEIAKHFEHKSGADYEVVLEAIDTMTCVAWYINDMKRKHEHAIRQQEIQSLLLGWKGPDLTSYGELVLEGTFRVQRARHERAVFLFDKTLLITKRRGDHYVYKTHIPCSSLMLIESTRDSLCFSLAHYKHGKQQHSLQAKNVEEKRVWTHHIKRLILENHHAIIPQKAKEAILEMDLFYPPRLPRYSPEHLKKSWSCQPLGDTDPRQGRRQSEPFQHRDRAETLPDRLHGHAGRRQSEPAKQILLQLGDRGLKHAGSAGALLETGEPPLHPTAWAAPEGVEEEEEDEDEEEDEKALCQDGQEELPGAGDLLVEPQEEQAGGHPPPSPEGPGKVSAAPQPPPGGPEAPEPASSPGRPAPREPERPAEDLQGLSSEEEEEDEEEEGAAGSILPPSVLDQASVIAERFGGSFSRRSSLALEGPAGRLGSRSGSALSLDAAGPQLESGEPGDSENPVPSPEPLSGTQRESLLSSRDRLLLDKIKSYYGHAEHHDAGFSVRRRESLSFIPKGLVRSSVCRIDGHPWAPGSPETHGASTEEPCRENTPQPVSVVPRASPEELRWENGTHTTSVAPRAAPEEPCQENELQPEPVAPRASLEEPCQENGPLSTPMAPRASPEEPYQENEVQPTPVVPKASLCRENGLQPTPVAPKASPEELCQENQLQATSMAPKASPEEPYQENEPESAPLVPKASSCQENQRQPTSMAPKASLEQLCQENQRQPTSMAPKASPEQLCQENQRQPASMAPKASLEQLCQENQRQPTSMAPKASLEQLCQENGPQPAEPLLIVEEDDVCAGGSVSAAVVAPRLLLTPPHAGTKVYQLARQYSLRIKSRRAAARRAPLPPQLLRDSGASAPAVAAPRDEGLAAASPSPGAPRSPPSPEPFAWPDVRELRARFGAPRPPPVTRSRSAPDEPCRGGRPAAKERGGGRSRSAETGGPGTPGPAPARHSSDGALWVTAEAPMGAGQRVLVLERLPAPTEPPAYVQIRSPTTREKICLKAVVERCKAYQASEEYRRRCAEPPGTPEPPRHGLVRDLRQKFQTLDAAS